MRLAVLHARLSVLELLRYPAFSIPTVLFPALAYVFFVVPQAGHENANLLMASYAAFGFLAVAFFEFGVGIASERTSPWDAFLRTLPVTLRARFAGRLIAALVFAGASALGVVIVAVATTPISLGAAQWATLVGALAGGAIPFGLLGIAIGYLASPRGALPLANVLYFALSFLGGLWTGPGKLPDVVERVSPVLPTREWSELLGAAVGGGAPPAWSWLSLAGWTVAFAAFAAWAYRRDEGVRYR